MTKPLEERITDAIERAKAKAREIAARTPSKVLYIDPREGRVYRETAGINTLRKLEQKRNVLYAEQERLIRTWSDE